MGLLDGLSKAGGLTLQHSTLHVFVANTHAFDKGLVDGIVEDNVDPIGVVERAALVMAEKVHGHPISHLVTPVVHKRLRSTAEDLLVLE